MVLGGDSVLVEIVEKLEGFLWRWLARPTWFPFLFCEFARHLALGGCPSRFGSCVWKAVYCESCRESFLEWDPTGPRYERPVLVRWEERHAIEWVSLV